MGQLEMLIEQFGDENKVQKNRKIQQFFKDKVYIGIADEPLKRKVYRGKRDQNGYRKNEVFYVNGKQDFRISEAILIKSVDYLISALAEIEDTSILIQSCDSKKQLFRIKQKHFLSEKKSVDDYKDFIGNQLSQDDNQSYLNDFVKKKIEQRDFKNIIEKIEVYETGLVCILNNGFEMTIQF